MTGTPCGAARGKGQHADAQGPSPCLHVHRISRGVAAARVRAAANKTWAAHGRLLLLLTASVHKNERRA